MSDVLRRVWLFGPPAIHAALIFWLSHQAQLPSTPGGDKTAHVVVFAILSMLLMRAFYFGTRWRMVVVTLTAFLLAALYGVSDEVHQSFVPGRDASLADVLADTLGALSGAALCLVLSTKVRRDTGA